MISTFAKTCTQNGATRCPARCFPVFTLAVVFLLAFITQFARGAESADGIFATPLRVASLDPGALTQWTDGSEQAVQLKGGPQEVLWTRDSRIDWAGVNFGASKNAGGRHLRIGWRRALPVGTVLVRGNVSVSVLKPSTDYPGHPGNEADWIPAQRLKQNRVTREEPGREEYTLWVLPSVTSTRAVRFTHTAAFADSTYAGWLGGAMLLSERMANLAPQAVASASTTDERSAKLNNESNDGTWGAWEVARETNAVVVSAARPETILLTWPAPVPLRGLNALWAGFGSADVQSYTGPADRHPREAGESDWQNLTPFTKVNNGYPTPLWPNWIDFGQTATTRAIRLRLTSVSTEQHGHLKGNTKQGRRVWLGEVQALHTLGAAELATVIIAPPAKDDLHPPIPIRFQLPEEGFVTLVIEGTDGKRIRNLIAETKFPAGENTVWWDGMDDLLRDAEAAKHGLYHIPEQFVAPGSYRVRGLWRKAVDLRYEFSIYNAGNPAWEVADKTGAWLANHTPPQSAMFIPGDRTANGQPLMFLGSYVSEGGHGLAWVDLDGRKQGGVGWVGGNWTGAPFLARDDGPLRATNVLGYAAAAWSDEDASRKAKTKVGEIRLTALQAGEHKPVLKYQFTPPQTNGGKVEWSDYIGGFAARDNLLVVSLTGLDQLLFVDGKEKKVLGTVSVPRPRGLAFDQRGRLMVLSGTRLLVKNDIRDESVLFDPHVLLITNGLEAPRSMTLDSAGNIYVSDHGASHQVKVFSPAGKFLRSIGQAGAPKAGPYDQQHMNHPDGLAVDSSNRLWVAENDYQPKRVSVWTLEGKFVRAFYGPSEYGGGGKLDPEDKTKFYYHGMEFRLDWEKGRDQIVNVFHRPGPDDLKTPDGYGSDGLPQEPHYIGGKKYFSNDHNGNPTGGPGVALIWQEVNHIARPVAGFGRVQDWKLLKAQRFAALWPAGANAKGDQARNSACFVWSDLNSDGEVQPEEVQFLKGPVGSVGSVTVAPDLSFVASRVSTSAMRLVPQRFTAAGVPVYDLAHGEILATNTQGPASSGGDQALWHKSGWTVLTTPPKPFSPMSVGAVFNGEARWSYPSPWPGLHASHESPAPDRPGQLIGTTRLLGDFVTPKNSDAGPLWGVNGNQGNMYLFTADGLFVAELFKDVRRGPLWAMPTAPRGMSLHGLSLHDENFWPSITQTKDGLIYVVDGARSSLVRVDGLDTIRRLPETTVTVSANDLAKARAFFVEAETQRQQNRGRGVLTVGLRETAPVVDGLLGDWATADWVDIDKSGVAAFFDSSSKPYDVRGSLMVAGGRLFAAFRTGDANLLRNSGEMANALFKTGGALDVMIGADAHADEKRSEPAAGDSRLLVTRVKNKTTALLYRAVVPGTKNPVPFSSPWRTIMLDQVEDVSAQVQWAGTNGNFEISIPLTTLNLKPQAGQKLKGDLGILRGNGFQTAQRVYWSNKASGIVADVPSEAELTPKLWGRIEFIQGPK